MVRGLLFSAGDEERTVTLLFEKNKVTFQFHTLAAPKRGREWEGTKEKGCVWVVEITRTRFV
jgi:hypothetical protein